jgi:hypothetical protein
LSWVGPLPAGEARGAGSGLRQLDNSEEKQDENDDKDEADAAAAVVAESWSHAIPAKAEHQNQNNQKDKHFCFLRCGEDFAVQQCDADSVQVVMIW